MAVTWAVTPTKATIEGKKRRIQATLTATGTVTAGGDNIPAFGAFGFKRNLDYLIIAGMDSATGLVFKFEPGTPGQIRVYESGTADAPLNEADTDSITGSVLLVEAVGW